MGENNQPVYLFAAGFDMRRQLFGRVLRNQRAVQPQATIAELIRQPGKILRQLLKEEGTVTASICHAWRCSSGRMRFKPASRAASKIFFVIAGDTPPRSFSTRSTVATPTPTRLASSASVIVFI